MYLSYPLLSVNSYEGRTFMCIKIIPFCQLTLMKLFFFCSLYFSIVFHHSNWSFLSTLPKKVQICFSRIHSHISPPKWPNISVVYILSVINYRQHANSVGTLSGHGSWILSVDFCPDNTHFVSRCVLGRLY